MSKSQEIYQQVTDRIVAALEQGTAPWAKPWVAGGRPKSMSTGKFYQGINPILLGMTSQDRGYGSPFWGTFHQIQEFGGNVRKGENQASGRGATTILFYKEYVRKDAEPVPNPRTGELEAPLSRVASAFRVFNAEQCENLPEKYTAPALQYQHEEVPEPQAVLDAYHGQAGGPRILHDVHGKANYVPAQDTVHIPPLTEHKSAEHYYATRFHEATHSTGHADRLARPGITELSEKGHGFGSHPYGVEELCAEMGAAFLCAETGVDAERVTENSAAYLNSWIQTIKGEPKMVVKAASQAGRAAELITEPERQATPEPVKIIERQAELEAV